jgi:hypothetical protein
MARDFGHEGAGFATRASLEEITRTPSFDTFLENNDKRYLVGSLVAARNSSFCASQSISESKVVPFVFPRNSICLSINSKLPPNRRFLLAGIAHYQSFVVELDPVEIEDEHIFDLE